MHSHNGARRATIIMTLATLAATGVAAQEIGPENGDVNV